MYCRVIGGPHDGRFVEVEHVAPLDIRLDDEQYVHCSHVSDSHTTEFYIYHTLTFQQALDHVLANWSGPVHD